MKCPIIDKKTQKHIDEVRESLASSYIDVDGMSAQELDSQIIAAISMNEGYDLTLNKEGEKSKSFKELMKLYNGNRQKALAKRFYMFSPDFSNVYGNWTETDLDVEINDGKIKTALGGERSIFWRSEIKNMETVDQKPENNIKELDKALNSIMDYLGVKVRSVKSIVDHNGNPIDAVGKADMINGIIEVVDNKASKTTLYEEQFHFITELIPRDSELWEELTSSIKLTDEYKEVEEQYSGIYGYNENKLISEAVAKWLANSVPDYKNDSGNVPRGNMLSKVLNWFADTFEPFLSMISPSIVDKYRTGSTSSLANKVAAKIISGELLSELNDISELPKDVFYDLNIEAQKKIDKAMEKNVYLATDENGDGYYEFQRKDGTIKKIFKRVTEVADKVAKSIYGERAYSELSKDGKTYSIHADKGTYYHAAMEYMLRDLSEGKDLDKSLILERSKLSIDETYPDEFYEMTEHEFNELKQLSHNLYNSAVAKQELIGGKAEDISWYFEKEVVNERTEVAGTIDLMIVYSNGVTDIYDYKTTNAKSISPEKIMKYNAQLTTHVNTLKENYNVKDIGAVRIVPIHLILDVNWRDGKINSFKNKEFRAIPNKVDEETYEGLSQIPLISERQHLIDEKNSSQDKIDSLNNAFESIGKQLEALEQDIRNEKSRSKRKKLEDQYLKRVSYMKEIAISGDISAFYLRVYNMADFINKKLVQSSQSENSISREDLDRYKGSLENARDIITNLRGALTYDMNNDNFEISEEDRSKVVSAKQLVESQLHDVNNRINLQIMEDHNNLPLDAKFYPKTWFDKTKSSKEFMDPRLKAYSVLNEKRHIEELQLRNKYTSRLKDLQEQLFKSGINRREAFKRIVKKDRVIGKFDSKTYDEIKELQESGNLAELKKIFSFDKQAYNKARSEFRDRVESEIRAEDMSDGEKSNKFAKAMKSFEDKYSNEKGAKNYRMSNPFMKMNEKYEEKYTSENWKWLNKPENKVVKDIYDLFIEINSAYRNSADRWEQVSNESAPEHRELAYLPKSVAEAIMDMDVSIPGLVQKTIEGVMIKDHDDMLGDVASDVKSIPEKLIHAHQDFVTPKQKSDIKKNLKSEGLKEGTKKFEEAFEKAVKAKGYENARNNSSKDLIEQIQALSLVYAEFEARKNAESKAKDLVDKMSEARYYKKNQRGKASKELSKEGDINEEGRDLLQGFIDQDIYGRYLKQDYEIGSTKISTGKLVSKLGGLMSSTLLPFKATLAMAQGLGGFFSTYLSSIEGQFHSKETFKDALKGNKDKERMKKISAIANLMDTRARGNSEDLMDAAKSNWVKRNFTKKNLFILYSLTDDKLDDIRLDSMSHYWRVKNGRLVHPSRLDNPTDYPTIYDILEVNEKDGSMELVHEEVQGNSNAILGDFRGKILGSIKRDRGAESSDYNSNLSTTIPMKLVTKYRSWIPGLARTRFSKTTWNSEIDMPDAGRYSVVFGDMFMLKQGDQDSVSFAKDKINQLMNFSLSSLTFGKITPKISKKATEYYFNKAMTNPEFAATMNENYDSRDEMLEAYEKSRTGRAKAGAIEFGAMMWLGLLLMGWKAIDDEDDETVVEGFVEDTAQRFFNELTTFVNPTQYTSLYQNSVPLFQEMVRLTKFMSNTADLTRDVVSGQDNPGDRSGFMHYGKRLFLPQLPRFIEEKIWEEALQEWIHEAIDYE